MPRTCSTCQTILWRKDGRVNYDSDKMIRPNFEEASQMKEPTTRIEEGLMLRAVAPPAIFDLLLNAQKQGSILSHFERAWWRLLPDGRFFFEPARLNDRLSNVYILQGAYEEWHGSFILQAESYRSPENLLALEAIIRREKGRHTLDCIFLNEGTECPILHITQPLTTEDKRGMFSSSQTLKGAPTPALYDLELSGETTSGSFSAVQSCLYTVASLSDFSTSEPDEIQFSISNGSVMEAAEEQMGACSLLLPRHTMMDAAVGILPTEWRFDLTVQDGHIKLRIKDIVGYQSVFSWYEAQEISTEESAQPHRLLRFCEARNLSLDCRLTGDTIIGEIRADGTAMDGQPARYEATIRGKRAADAPQTLMQLEQKIALQSGERSWQDTNIFNGEWQSQRFGQVRLRQSGQTVTGTFSAQANGNMTGVATEHRTVFDWTGEHADGRGILHAVRGGQFLAGFFLQPDSAPAVELLYRASYSSSLVSETLRLESNPLEWNKRANILKSLNRHDEALTLYEKSYEAFGKKRRELPPDSEAWALILSYEWSALLDFMNCAQMQNLHLMNVHPHFKTKADEETSAFKRLLRAFNHAIQLQAEIYSLAQRVKAEEGVIFPDFGARLSSQIEVWRRSLSDEASRMDVLEISQQSLANLLKILVSAGSYKQALVVAESARARAFSDLMQNRIYREQAQASLMLLKTDAVETLLANTMATTAPVELEMLEQSARNQRSAIVEYFLTDDELFIWTISPDGEINFHQHHQQALRQTLADLIALARTNLGVQSREAVTLSAAQPSQQFLPLLTELYQLLIEPITRWLPKNEHEPVIFIPHGMLFLVPFPALFDKHHYLIERHTISVAPSIRFVETTHQLAAMRKNYPQGLLIIGDPLMPLRPGATQGRAERLPQLEFARREAEQIARRLATKPMLGAEAVKVNILQLLSQQKLIHLATHGLLDDNGPAMEIPGAIALAPASEDDGFLTATEIAALNLQARLVVMSACNTGRGRLSADGLVGLMRAFLTAGAECVVASLWSVADRSTQELMVEFYENLLRGLPIAQALRQAMLKLKADKLYGNPLDWAAFTVTGQSQRPLFDVA